MSDYVFDDNSMTDTLFEIERSGRVDLLEQVRAHKCFLFFAAQARHQGWLGEFRINGDGCGGDKQWYPHAEALYGVLSALRHDQVLSVMYTVGVRHEL